MSETFDAAEGARRILLAREKRRSVLPAAIFGEPAWEMLLDLLVSADEGRSVPLNSACIASGAPTTTAMRWVGLLQSAGLVEQRPDPSDRRRKLLVLTHLGEESLKAAVRDLLAEMAGSMQLIVG